MPLAGFEGRLLAYYAFSLDLAQQAGAFPDVPVTPHELYGGGAVVFDGDAISEDVLALHGARVAGMVEVLYDDGDAFGGKDVHTLFGLSVGIDLGLCQLIGYEGFGFS